MKRFNELLKNIIIRGLTAGSEQDYAKIARQLTLAEAVAQIDWLFGCDRVLKEFNSDITIPYYTQSEWGYRKFHSKQDALHMALNFDGVFDPDGYLVQPRIVGKQIKEISAKDVLELGCGKGFNSQFLAEQYPEVKFTGIDLTPLHIKLARQKSQTLSNLNFKEGNFNQLEFADQSFDVVFAFECLCHAEEAKMPLTEIFRVLRPGGRLIVFDGYRKVKLEQSSQLLQTATQLKEVSMAVRHGFPMIEDWNAIAQFIGFELKVIEDLSFAIQPTLLKLQKLSVRFFGLSWRAKLLAKVLPQYLIKNSIAGLLMPFTFHPTEGTCGYYKLILERR